MNKTLHQKLTAKHFYSHPAGISFESNENLISGFRQEMKIMREAATDLLQPRPEAISRLLEMSRSL